MAMIIRRLSRPVSTGIRNMTTTPNSSPEAPLKVLIGFGTVGIISCALDYHGQWVEEKYKYSNKNRFTATAQFERDLGAVTRSVGVIGMATSFVGIIIGLGVIIAS